MPHHINAQKLTLQLISCRNLLAMLTSLHAQSYYSPPTPQDIPFPTYNNTLNHYISSIRQKHTYFCAAKVAPAGGSGSAPRSGLPRRGRPLKAVCPDHGQGHHQHPNNLTTPNPFPLYTALTTAFPTLIAATLSIPSNPTLLNTLTTIVYELDSFITSSFCALLSKLNPTVFTNNPLPFAFLFGATQPLLNRLHTLSSPQRTRLSTLLMPLTKQQTPPLPYIGNAYHVPLTPTLQTLIKIFNPHPHNLTPTEQSLLTTFQHIQVNLTQYPTSTRKILPQRRTLSSTQAFLTHYALNTTPRLPWNPHILPTLSTFLNQPKNAQLNALFSTVNEQRATDLARTPNDPTLALNTLNEAFLTLATQKNPTRTATTSLTTPTPIPAPPQPSQAFTNALNFAQKTLSTLSPSERQQLINQLAAST